MTEFSESQKEFIRELFTKLNNTINEKVEELREEFKVQVSKIKEDVAEAIEQQQQKTQELGRTNEKLQNSIIYLERKLRKNNIIIFGIEKEEQNLYDSTLNIFRNILELDINASDLNDVYRLTTRNSEKYPVVVEFLSFQTKRLVLNNARKLKGQNIYIARDQCLDDRIQSKTLAEYQKKARAKGQKAYIKAGKLYIDDKVFTVKQLEEEDEATSTLENRHQAAENRIQKKEERDKKRIKFGTVKEQKATEDRIQTRSIIGSKK